MVARAEDGSWILIEAPNDGLTPNITSLFQVDCLTEYSRMLVFEYMDAKWRLVEPYPVLARADDGSWILIEAPNDGLTPDMETFFQLTVFSNILDCSRMFDSK